MRLFDYQRASKLMDQEGIDCLLAHTATNAGYLADYYFHVIFQPSWLLDDGSMTYISFVGLPKDQSKMPFHVVWIGEEGDILAKKPWIEDQRYYGRSMAIMGSDKQRQVQHADPVACVVDALKERGLEDGTIGLEMRHMPVTIYEQLKAALPNASFRDATPTLLKMRMIKSIPELERIRKANQASERAIKMAFDHVYPGMNELEFDRLLRKTLGEDGASHKWTHSAFGPKGATCVLPTENQVQSGQLVRVDIGGAYDDYVCDLSRVAVLGEPNSQILKAHDACLQTYQAVRKEIGPGVKASNLHRLATVTMKRAGYQLFTFLVGHGVGRDVHEPPFLIPEDHALLEIGMVIAIEIPMRIQGIGSINIEDEVLITENGVEPMCMMDQQLYRIKDINQ